MNRITRRQALKFAAIAGGSLLLPVGLDRIGYAGTAGSPRVKPFTLNFRVPPVLSPVRSDDSTDYYEITIKKNQVNILPGYTTEIWAYNGIYPGPTIVERKDRQSVIRFINLPADDPNSINTPTSVHLHGMASLPQYDGYAEDLTFPGYYKDYIYPDNRAASLWYHDHAIHNTARNVYMGLAGFFLVQDDLERDLDIPKGKYDVPLLISDKVFGRDGSFIFDDQGHSSVMGDVLLVNGVPWPRMAVERRKYRFRVCNGSNSRSYKFALSNDADFIMIATDAGLRSAPAPVKNFRIGMAERYEFILDFSQYPIGTQIVLRNLSLPNNKNYDGTNQIMRFDVVSDATSPDSGPIPSTLRRVTPIEELLAGVKRTREFRYERSGGMWKINGKTWDKNRVDAHPDLGDTEIWRLVNNSGGWFHPIHIHLADFQIIDRNGKPPFEYEKGWKDVFYVGENETVRVVGAYQPHKGMYMTHCHNTVHEDHDMMSQFQVAQGGPDPITTAPAQPLPAPPL